MWLSVSISVKFAQGHLEVTGLTLNTAQANVASDSTGRMSEVDDIPFVRVAVQGSTIQLNAGCIVPQSVASASIEQG